MLGDSQSGTSCFSPLPLFLPRLQQRNRHGDQQNQPQGHGGLTPAPACPCAGGSFSSELRLSEQVAGRPEPVSQNHRSAWQNPRQSMWGDWLTSGEYT